MPQKTVLITGGSSGIGLELAKVFAKNNHNLALTARHQDKLEKVKSELEKNNPNIKVNIFAKDLGKRTEVRSLYEETKKNNLSVDILVNNAGFGAYGLFRDIEVERDLDMINVNVESLTHLTKLYLKDMLKRKTGHILNVASTAAFQPGPMMATYFATKAYVLSLSEALTNELENTGIKVSVLCPGPTKTNFDFGAGAGNSKIFKNTDIMEASVVAEVAYRGLIKNKTIIIPGLKNKLIIQLNRITPRRIVTRVVRYLQES